MNSYKDTLFPAVTGEFALDKENVFPGFGIVFHLLNLVGRLLFVLGGVVAIAGASAGGEPDFLSHRWLLLFRVFLIESIHATFVSFAWAVERVRNAKS